MSMCPISILLATYNGEAYLKDQLDSLFRQSNQSFSLFVRDDGSTDETMQILTEYVKLYPDRIHVSQNRIGSGSAKNNFMQMLIAHKNEYVLLCDQDDVWKPDKIDVTLRAMQDAEMEYGKGTPILVHTDLTPVDEHLCQIAPSFKKTEQIRFGLPLNQLLVQNSVTGCTAMINRALSDCILSNPENCLMHDWWLALTAAALGKIIPLDKEQTVLYRQHGHNELGVVHPFSPAYFRLRIQDSSYSKRLRIGTYRQAQALFMTYGERLSDKDREMLCAYSAMEHKNKLERIKTLIQYRVLKHNFLRIVGQLILA